jgi:3-oxoacyl-[acyl-carrier-protein] synthase-3
MINAVITGTGSYAPERILTNADFEKLVETSDEWIVSRTGIKERHISSNGSGTSELALRAGQRALEQAGIGPQDLDVIIVGTVTPDYQVPSAACIVQEKMGAFGAAAMDVGAACASFIYGLTIANGLIRSRQYKRILVIGAETLSSITNYQDRGTCVLFGDGAGAVVLEAKEGDEPEGVLGSVLETDGRYAKLLWIPVGGSVSPFKSGNDDELRVFLEMNGNEVFKVAVRAMVSASEKVCEKAGVKKDDIALFIPHQANIRIIDAVKKRLGMPTEKVFVNIQKYGNTSSASVPLALDEAVASGRINQGDLVLMVAFGGGLTWGASIVRL